MMIIQFNSLGVITSVDTSNASFRQGSKGEVIQAVFVGKSNSTHTAKINFTRPDGTAVQNLIMSPDPSDQSAFLFELDDLWFLAISGNATMTIFLYNASNVIQAQGQATIPIESTDYDGEPTITITQYDSLLTALAGKLGMPVSSLRVDELPEEGTTGVFYVVHDDENDDTRYNIYIWNSTTREYIWVGSNELDLNKYYTKQEGQEFEQDVNNQINNIENQVQQIVSGSPKGVYATLAALQAAYPTGTTGIYVVSADGHWYYWNGSAWTDGGTYQATQIADGSITYPKLADSLKDAYVKKFIDDSAKITLNRYQQYNGDYNNSYNGVSLVQVDVRYGEKIKYGFTLTSPDIRGLAFYDKNGTYLSGVQVSTTEQIITVPRKAVLCKATIHNYSYYELQIIKDCFDLENEIIDQKISFDLLKSKGEKLDFIDSGNLYNGTYENGYYDNAGSIVSSTTYHNITIPVVEGDVIRAKYDTADLYNQNGCLFLGNTFVGENRYVETLVDNTYYEITIPQGVDNIRLNFKSTSGYVVIKNSAYNANAQVGKCYMPNLDLSVQINEQLDNRGIALKDDVSYAHIFRKVACIGDSITVGYYGDSGGVVYGTFPNYNYPSFLEKLINCDTVNLGWSGQSAQTWYQGYSTHFASADIDWTQYDAAIIFLGTNGGLSGNVDPDDNSQMGYYCKIIEMLLAANPQISIFLCTSPWTGNKEELYPNLDTQVIACGTHYNLPVLRLDQSSLLTYEQRTINQPYDNRLHFGRVGLMRIASEIVRCINENGASNPSYFNKLYGTHY